MSLVNIPAVVCSFTENPGKTEVTPSQILMWFGHLKHVGWFEASHERVDAHHLEPYYPNS